MSMPTTTIADTATVPPKHDIILTCMSAIKKLT